jgi:inositol-phosphate phosphatase/L-galactose 1-phosphate phosphatase/histidinol-phosphatase
MSTVLEPACPAALVAFAEQLADAAGAVIRRYFRSGVAVIDKADLSPVTAADREAEQTIRQLIAERHPGHGVIGEEHGADRPDAELVWVLDPIDGTKSFISGRPLFGTLIALCRAGRPILGVIDHPALGERWVGATGHPTRHDGREVRTRPCPELAGATLFASSPHMFDDGHGAPGFERVRRAVKLVQYGSDCYHYGLVASGFGDIAIEARLQIYDYLACVPVIEGAGGRVTDWQGHPLTIHSGNRVVAVGDPGQLEPVLELLAG